MIFRILPLSGIGATLLLLGSLQVSAQTPTVSGKQLRKIRERLTPKLEMHTLPDIPPPPEPRITPEDQKLLEGLIAALAQLPDSEEVLVFCEEGSGYRLSILDPIPRDKSERTAHRFPWFKPMVELVKMGPKAIPALLNHLDDPALTKIIVRSPDSVYMWHNPVLDLNSADPDEARFGLQFDPWWFPVNFEAAAALSEYRVKTGDLCLVILGHIVGRSYLVLSRFPTACAIISSPVENPDLVKAVRTIWTNPTPSRRLFDSLLKSYSTYGIKADDASDGRSYGDAYRRMAAKRLLYYFPTQTKGKIVEENEP